MTAATTVAATADHTLYAHWTANAYTVSFDAQSGVAPSPASKSVTYATAYGALAATTRAGYTFGGWFTAATGGTQVTAATTVAAAADHTLYAHWTATTYTVAFDAQSGAVPSPASKSVTPATAYGALASTTRTGYTFGGWFTAATGGTQVTEVTPVTASADHTLYAHWTANTYTVTFDAQSGAAPSPASKSVTYASAYGVLAATTRTGYTFGGWFTAATGGTQVTEVTAVAAAADHTLYARWTVAALQFTVGTNSGSQNLQVLVPVQVNRFTNISSFQFSLHWNSAVATYVGVEQFGVPGLAAGNFGTALTSSGTLTVSWEDPAGLCKSVTNGTTLFAVRVLLVGSPGACGPVTIDGTPTAIEAANCDLVPTPVETIAGQLCVSQAVFALIAGKLTYYAPPTNAPDVGGVTVSLTGDTNQSIQTPADGTYSFTVNAGSSYTLTPGKTNDTPAANGVTTLDISLIRRHILGIAALDSPYKLLAADVNCSGSATTVDIAFIRRIILGITNVFPCGLWRFVPAAYVFPDPLSPWSAPGSSGYTNILADHTNESFVAIKLGDVNNSWKPPAGAALGAKAGRITAKGSGQEVTFAVSSHNAQPGETVTASVAVSGFRQVTSAQFTLEWDPAVLGFVGTGGDDLNVNVAAGNFGTTLTNSGKLAFSWDDPNAAGVTVADGTVVFTASFVVVGSSGSASPLAVVDVPTLREVVVNFELATFGSVDGQVILLAPAISVSPASQDFGTIQVGTTDERTFYVTNSGGRTVRGSATVPAPFSIVSGGTYNLAANAAQAVVIRYSPAVAGTNNAIVTFTGGAGATRPVIGAAYSANLLVAGFAGSPTNGAGDTNRLTRTNYIVVTPPVSLAFGPAEWLPHVGVRLTVLGNMTGSVTIQWAGAVTNTLSNWATLIRFSNFIGSTQYLDSDATNFGTRFYRAVTP